MAADASKYDLTSELGKYLDRHLVFPLLEFLQAKKVYPEADGPGADDLQDLQPH